MTSQSCKGDRRKAVVLLSGGLDSYTSAAICQEQDFDVFGLTVAYGQRHSLEIDFARRIGEKLGLIEHKIFELDLRELGGSALTSAEIEVPQHVGGPSKEGIPVTYVPAQNTIMLSLALGWAEVLGAYDIFIGVNSVDYSGYPDCREEFIRSFETMANLATAAAVEGKGVFKLHAPLLHLGKGEIIQRGVSLGLDYSLTISCYDPDEKGRSCRKCEACYLRLKGFTDAGLCDPLEYAPA
ncbi:MAG: 7-cyano-7-deazaguanine synthase QueC [Planctomycetes bacterium]|nr:7-cyano-7-deazaguanine synthase QueC [Planctomycetota bacterium]